MTENSFSSYRNQDASPSIRGYVYQVDATIKRWLQLQPDEILELERGEDLDVVRHQAELFAGALKGDKEKERELEQFKDYTREVTLNDESVRKCIFDFFAQQIHNQKTGIHLTYAFVTPTQSKSENPPVLHNAQVPADLKALTGIKLWQEVWAGQVGEVDLPEVLRGLQKTLNNMRQPEHATEATWTAFRHMLSPEGQQQFLDFVRHFEFRMLQPNSKGLATEIHQHLMDRHLVVNVEQAERVYAQLFMQVFRKLSEPEIKQLTRKLLEDTLNTQVLSVEEQDLLARLKHFLDVDAEFQIQQARFLWRKALYREALEVLEQLRHSERWNLLHQQTRIWILQEQAGKHLILFQDTPQTRELIAQVEQGGGDARLLHARRLVYLDQMDEALKYLEGMDDLDAHNLRSYILIHSGHAEHLEELEEIQAAGKGNIRTLQHLASAALNRGDVKEALEWIQRAEAHPEKDEFIDITRALILYRSAVSNAWGAVEQNSWPIPVDPIFVRRDDEATTALQEAASIFSRVADTSRISAGRRMEFLVRHLAALCLLPNAEQEANTVAQTLLLEHPKDFQAYMRWISVCTPSSALLDALRTFEARDLPVELESKLMAVAGLFHVYMSMGRKEEAATLLERHQGAFEDVPHQQHWEEMTSLLEWNPEEIMLPAIHPGQPLPKEVLFLAESLGRMNRWADLAPIADQLVEQVETLGMLRIAAYSLINAGQNLRCRLLLESHQHLAPGNTYPPDVRYVWGMTMIYTGQLNEATDLLDQLTRETVEVRDLQLYMGLLYNNGDYPALELLGRNALERRDLPAEMLLSLANTLWIHDKTLARDLLETAIKAELPDQTVPQVFALADQLQADDLKDGLERKLAILSLKPDSGVVQGNGKKNMREKLHTLKLQQFKISQVVNRRYGEGDQPYHYIRNAKPLAEMYHLDLAFAEQATEASVFSVLTRHGGRIQLSGLDQDLKGKIHLDVTAVVTAFHFGILAHLVEHFAPLYISPFVMPALMEEMEHFSKSSPGFNLLRLRVQTALKNGWLKEIPLETPSPHLLDAQFGEGWADILIFSSSQSSLLVDDLDATLIDSEKTWTDIPVTPEDVLLPADLVLNLDLEPDHEKQALDVFWIPYGKPQGILLEDRQTLVLSDTTLGQLAHLNLLKEVGERFNVYTSRVFLHVFEEEEKRQARAREALEFLQPLQEFLFHGLRKGQFIRKALPEQFRQSLPDGLPSDLEFLAQSTYPEGAVVWVEDRSVNRNTHLNGATTVTLTEILKALQGMGMEVSSLVQKQRMSGMGIVPTFPGELFALLKASRVRGGQLRPTPGLQAWLRHAKNLMKLAPSLRPTVMPMGNAPLGELVALVQVHEAVQLTLLALWSEGEVTDREVRASWLIQAVPWGWNKMLGFAHAQKLSVYLNRGLVDVMDVLLLIQKVPESEVVAFQKWFEATFVVPGQEKQLALFLWRHFQSGIVQGEYTTTTRDGWIQRFPKVLREQLNRIVLSAPQQ